jgi:hypothetical protein
MGFARGAPSIDPAGLKRSLFLKTVIGQDGAYPVLTLYGSNTFTHGVDFLRAN